MGIKGLKALLKKNAPSGIEQITVNSLKNKSLSVDSSILLYKYRYTYNTSNNFHILGFLNKVIEFLEYGIIPIFVFDGKPPEAKKLVLEKRNETRNKMKERVNDLLQEIKDTTGESSLNFDDFIDTDSDSENDNKIKELKKAAKQIQKNILYVKKNHSLEVMEMLNFIGVSFLHATGESEQTCAFLQKNGYTDYVFSEDTDSLTFGGSVLFNTKGVYTIYDIQKILSALNLTQDQFIDTCIISGCDYTNGIPKIGPVSALKIIKTHGSIENFLASPSSSKYTVPDSFDYQTAREIFKESTEITIQKGTFNEPELIKILEKHDIQEINFFINKLKKLIN